jgi:hypothetical protein
MCYGLVLPLSGFIGLTSPCPGTLFQLHGSSFYVDISKVPPQKLMLDEAGLYHCEILIYSGCHQFHKGESIGSQLKKKS